MSDSSPAGSVMLSMVASVDGALAATRESVLLEALTAMGPCVVAFSGGVDSTYLAWAARQALGDRAEAVTAQSASVPGHVRREAAELAGRIGIAHRWIHTDELADARYTKNDRERCFWCKSELYSKLQTIAAAVPGMLVVDGTNRDDLADHRPGRRAASELGVRSPLADAGLTKQEIRWLSRRAGLPTWDRPASPCLSSRVPYGSAIDPGKLQAIDAAEDALRQLGFREFRVRHHGDLARLELAAGELPRVQAQAAAVQAAVRSAGFQFVCVDLEPFRSGRLNEVA